MLPGVVIEGVCVLIGAEELLVPELELDIELEVGLVEAATV